MLLLHRQFTARSVALLLGGGGATLIRDLSLPHSLHSQYDHTEQQQQHGGMFEKRGHYCDSETQAGEGLR